MGFRSVMTTNDTNDRAGERSLLALFVRSYENESKSWKAFWGLIIFLRRFNRKILLLPLNFVVIVADISDGAKNITKLEKIGVGDLIEKQEGRQILWSLITPNLSLIQPSPT